VLGCGVQFERLDGVRVPRARIGRAQLALAAIFNILPRDI
jgi:hypothetical protein